MISFRQMLRLMREERDGHRVEVDLRYVTSQGALREVKGARLLRVSEDGTSGQFKVPGGVRRLLLYTVLSVNGEEVGI